RPQSDVHAEAGIALVRLAGRDRGRALNEAQVAYTKARLDGAQVAKQPDGIWSLRWPFELPQPWWPTAVTLVLLIPPQFPAQAPSGFDIVGPVSRAGAPGAGAGLRQVGTEQWTHFCWNVNGTIDYTAED